MFSGMIFGDHLPTWALLVELALVGLTVILAGARLTRLADALAERLGLGRGWVGLILLATVTSLPEVVAGSTATWIGNTNLAFATIFGSCSFNIVIIVILNVWRRRGSVLREVQGAHVLTSSFGLVLMTLALLTIALVNMFENQPRAAQTCEWVCMSMIVAAYLVCMRLTFRQEQRIKVEIADSGSDVAPEYYGQVALVSLVLVVASWWLAQTGDVLSTHEIKLIGRPLGATFVGAIFLACATSLPEIATSITAVRMRKFDLALGNIFGSNMFNIFVIPMLKLVSCARGDPLLITGGEFENMETLITGLLPILLTGIAVGGLTYRSDRKLPHRLELETVLIGGLYVTAMFLVLASNGR